MDAVKVGNALTYAHAGMIVLGEKLPGEITPRVQAVADFLNAHGVTAKPVGDMVRRQWGKLMLNVGLNQTVMVFEGDYGTVQQPVSYTHLDVYKRQDCITKRAFAAPCRSFAR